MTRDKQDILDTLGENLRRKRVTTSRHLSQDKLARKLGWSTTTYQRLENGEADSGVTKFVQAAWALKMTPAELFEGLEKP